MKTRLVLVVLGLSILMIILSGIKINQAYKAEPTIYYDGQKKEFAYFNIKDKEIFSDLKELMPGDKEEREIKFKAENVKRNTKFFLKVSINDDKNISQYIKVFVDDKELEKYGEYVEFANLSKDSELQLKIVVDVPKEVGNEIEDIKEDMLWEILIQEEDGNLVVLPNTSDDTNIVLYSIIFILSMVVMICAIIRLVIIRRK